MTVSLTSTTGRGFVLLLAHEARHCAPEKCQCDVEKGLEAGRGPTLPTPSGEVTHPALPAAVLAIHDVMRAMKGGDVSASWHVPEASRMPVAATANPMPRASSEPIPPDAKPKKKRGAS